MSPRAALTAGVVVAVLGLSAYAGWRVAAGEEQVSAPDAPLADQCGDVPGSASRVTLVADDGADLGGALVGPADASAGLVLRQGAGQTLCDWLPWAARVTEETGVRVLLFDRRGHGSSPGQEDLAAEAGDIRTATQRLAADGADRVALMGSSMGNGPVLESLPLLPEPPCAVISVSSVASPPGDLPAGVWVTWETGNASVADSAEEWVAAAGPGVHELPVDTDDHSLGLVTRHPEVQDFLLDAVGSCAT